MLEILLTLSTGLSVGFLLATPIGIINLTIINLISNQRYKEATYLGAGSASLDIFYSFISLYSTSIVFQTLQSFVLENPKFIFLMEVIMIIVLFLFGINKIRKVENVNIKKIILFDKLSNKLHPYFVGLLMATTHILIPSFLPGYAYMSAILLKNNLIVDSFLHFLFFAICFGIGTQTFYTIMILFSKKYSHLFLEKFKKVIPKVIGILFLLFGLLLTYRITSNVDWVRIFN